MNVEFFVLFAADEASHTACRDVQDEIQTEINRTSTQELQNKTESGGGRSKTWTVRSIISQQSKTVAVRSIEYVQQPKQLFLTNLQYVHVPVDSTAPNDLHGSLGWLLIFFLKN